MFKKKDLFMSGREILTFLIPKSKSYWGIRCIWGNLGSLEKKGR